MDTTITKKIEDFDFNAMLEMRKQGKTYEKIAKTLNASGCRTVTGQPVSNATVSGYFLKKGIRCLTRKPQLKSLLTPTTQTRPQTSALKDNLRTIIVIAESNLPRELKEQVIASLVK